MDNDLLYKIKEVFFRDQSVQKAIDILSEHIGGIDFDDEDEVNVLCDLIRSALNNNDKNEDGVEFVKFLVDSGFDINFKFPKKDCLILKLARDTALSPSVFRKLADLGADVYAETTVGSNVLTLSAMRTFNGWSGVDREISERLPVYIAENFDLNRLDHPDEYGITPLMYAVIKNKVKLAETLLRKGSDANATGGQPAVGYSYRMKMYGVSPFALACRDGNLELAKLLLDAGADDTACDEDGTPALFSLVYMPFEYRNYVVPRQIEISARKGEIAKLLKNPDFADSQGNTLLMKSLCRYDYTGDKQTSPYNNEPVMNVLLERGANVNAANYCGERPLHFASEFFDKMIKPLLDAGANIDARDNKGNTALITACRTGNEKAARLLLRKGADFNIKNADGKSAMDIAAEKGLTDALELMMQS